MMLSHASIGLSVHLEEGTVNVLVLEKPERLQQFICDLKYQLQGQDGEFVLSIDNKEINMSKYSELIVDPWAIDFNSRAIKSKLLAIAKDEVAENLYDSYLEMRAQLMSFMECISERMQYPVQYNSSFEIENLLKFADIKIDMLCDDLVESVTSYIKLIASMGIVRVLFMVNAKSYFGADDLSLIYKEANYNKIQLILIESVQREVIEGEKTIIIDADNCIIEL